eukprot:Selendium_serpulae@DN7400_c0_g1_i1.p1
MGSLHSRSGPPCDYRLRGPNKAVVKSRFYHEEIEMLRKIYRDLSSRSDGDGISKSTFLDFFELPGLWGEQLFQQFDTHKTESIQYEEFLMGIALCCRGTRAEKVQVLFKVFDLNRDGFIQKEEFVTKKKKKKKKSTLR